MAKSQKAHSSRKTKCPKGSRRNSKTGRCRKVKSVKSTKSKKSGKSKKSMKIPKRDIKTLLENPSAMSRKYFDEVYGDGAAAKVLKSAKVGGARKKGKRGHCGEDP